MINRKGFLKVAVAAGGGMVLAPAFLTRLFAGEQQQVNQHKNILVFVQLSGGNDGLNMIVPWKDPLYYAIRKTLALSKDEVLAVQNEMAWHPACKGLWEIQQKGHLCVIQNTGYPNPSRSHFRSMEIWQTASSGKEYPDTGWIGRLLDANCSDEDILAGLTIDQSDSPAMHGKEAHSISMQDPEKYERMMRGQTENDEVSDSAFEQLNYVRKLSLNAFAGADEIQQALLKTKDDSTTYPTSKLGKNLHWIARLIKGNLNTGIYYTGMGGFDTHTNQIPVQQTRLKELSEAIYTFYKDIDQSGMLSSVTLVVFSEFGRRVKPNGSGTDHGKAGPMLVVSNALQKTIYGGPVDLQNLNDGDLISKVDFRSVYAELVQKKFNLDPGLLQIPQIEKIDFLRG